MCWTQSFFWTSSVRAEVIYDWVTIGDAGNLEDDTGFGAVAEEFRMGRFEVTNTQYVDFLNSVATTDTNELYIFKMTSWPGGGIVRQGAPGDYRYSVKPGWESRPALYVTWWSALRFANWMHNGQPAGGQDASTTEDGAYTLNEQTIPDAMITRNGDAAFFVPSENQWYKAAYYKSGGLNAGYWDYATASDEIPASLDPPGNGNAVNYRATLDEPRREFTDVGAYVSSPSSYGTFDQNGNAWEWTEEVAVRSPEVSVIIRGGSSPRDADRLAAEWRQGHSPDHGLIGFRLATLADSLLLGDFNSNGVLSVADLDLMTLSDRRFDVTGDGITSLADVDTMVVDLLGTWRGDSDGDGEFGSSDWVHVFTKGKYNTGAPAVWTEGDWDFDGIFGSRDFVAAFIEGGYGMGPRPSTSPVPETATAVPMLIGAPLFGYLRRRRR